jgi:pimeloyl-ACP methyl ester carboxylesterase
MIEDPRGRIDYEEIGNGPTVVLIPGSCATGAAWRPVAAAWNGAFRVVTTSLLGYGGTVERRTEADASMDHEADVVEAVIARAGGKVHLVGHSYGAAAALAFAVRDRSALASLTLIEMPPPTLLRDVGERGHFQSFRDMTDRYEADFAGGRSDAVANMIDFYGGAGTWQSWPPRCATTRSARRRPTFWIG